MAAAALLTKPVISWGDGVVGSGLPDFTIDATYYVNASTGNDANDGSIGAPWQSFTRAWDERNKYSVIKAKFMVQLIGAGPYILPVMGASLCGNGGYFIIRGDTAAEINAAGGSGTFASTVNATTGQCTTSVLPATDSLRGQFIRITSGAAIGVVCQVQTHSTVGNTLNFIEWSGGAGVIIGDSFQIFQPGTAITYGANAPTNWSGGFASAGNPFSPPKHIFYNCQLSASLALACQINYTQCRQTGTLRASGCGMYFGASTGYGVVADYNTLFGLTGVTAANPLRGAGLSQTTAGGTLAFDGGCNVVGVIFTGSIAAMTIGSFSSTDTVVFTGCRLNSAVTVANGSYLEFNSAVSGHAQNIRAAITCTRNSKVRIVSAQTSFVLTAGSCLVASYGGEIYIENSNVNGGTSAAAGFGSDARNGGFIYWKNFAPTLTGGTAGQDLAVDGATAANATLSSTPLALLSTVTRSMVARVA